MKPRILFTSICKPFETGPGNISLMDQMSFRLTRAQEPFVLYEHTHASGLHLIAQNISAGSVVLEYPTLEQFEEELAHRYNIVAITFKPCNAENLLAMCELVRKKLPKAKIVVGGYGAICTSELFKNPAWEGKIDKVCQGEGVSFMRDLLGEPPKNTLDCHLPKEGSTLPWLNPRAVGTIGIILSGIGCPYRCPFCITSATTGGRYMEVMDANQIYRTMLGYWRTSPFMSTVTVYDENFMAYRRKVDVLGGLIQNDKEFGLRRLNYAAFGSLSVLHRYEPDELLLSGVDSLWVGVESKFTALNKRDGMKPEEAFPLLHSIGIKTVGSWIIGDDYQTPENLEEDMSYFISLDSTFQQLAILAVTPGSPLWEDMSRKGRIPPGVGWGEYHIYGNTMDFKNFTHDELLAHVDRMYRRIYEENGPALIKVLETNLNGYEYCMKSRNALLRKDKSQFFRSRCESYYPFLKTAYNHAPSDKVSARVSRLEKRFREVFGPIRADQEMIADQILRKADEEAKHHEKGLSPVREEAFRRYTYPPSASRSADRPYSVEYPEAARLKKAS